MIDHKTYCNKSTWITLAVCGSLAATVLVWRAPVRAATLDLVPGTGAYAPGEQFAVDVFVSSQDQPVNAVSGTISFPPDKLQVVSVDKAESVVNLWIQDPSYSNANGTIAFEGAILNPGFEGLRGRLVRIAFRARAAGIAPVDFSIASVLANNGQGTNVLEHTTAASFSVSQAGSEYLSNSGSGQNTTAGAMPYVGSATNPDQSQWYANPNPQFWWQIASDTTAVRLGYGAAASSLPTVFYAYPFSSKQLQDVADGSWYFSVQLKNASGWGTVAHFKFNIDAQSPVIKHFAVASQTDSMDPYARILIDASDALSGMGLYEFRIDGTDPVSVSPDQVLNGQYALGPEPPGVHALSVRASDRAGNAAVASTSFAIVPMDTPMISDYSHTIRSGEPFSVRGTGVPNAIVRIWISPAAGSESAKQYETRTDPTGSFYFSTPDGMREGAYSFWLAVRSAKGAESFKTDAYAFTVVPLPFFEWVVRSVSALGLGVFVFGLAAAAFAVLRRRSSRSGFQKQTGDRQARAALHAAFLKTYQDIANHARLLEKAGSRRALTREEEYLVSYFRDKLDELERVIDSEIGLAGSHKDIHHE